MQTNYLFLDVRWQLQGHLSYFVEDRCWCLTERCCISYWTEFCAHCDWFCPLSECHIITYTAFCVSCIFYPCHLCRYQYFWPRFSFPKLFQHAGPPVHQLFRVWHVHRSALDPFSKLKINIFLHVAVILHRGQFTISPKNPDPGMGHFSASVFSWDFLEIDETALSRTHMRIYGV